MCTQQNNVSVKPKVYIMGGTFIYFLVASNTRGLIRQSPNASLIETESNVPGFTVEIGWKQLES